MQYMVAMNSGVVAGGGGGAGGARAPPSDNFLGALKFVIANVKYYTKYVKSSFSTKSKIVVILAFLNNWTKLSLVSLLRSR